MGRIKTALIKRVSHELLDQHRNEFKDNFEGNKKKIADFAELPSKKLRNIIAGYITRLMKNKEEV